MKFPRSLVLFVAIQAGSAGAQIAPGEQPSVAADAVTLSGEIVSEGMGTPIAFGTVRLLPLGRERFTDRSGTFAYYSVLPGEYRVQVRMVGYLPFDTAFQVRPRVPAVLVIAMRRIPTSLDEVQITAPPRRCIFPDEMGYVDDPELGTVLEEARKNAQREQLLRRTYPFEYRLAQSHDTYDPATRKSTMLYDTVTYRSDDSWRYRKGRVVSDERNRIFGDVRLMRLPTLADLADRTFLSAHCFKYAGVVDEEGKPAHRIDFLSDSALVAPDVEGSIFLDSATYFIRRAQFRLTRGGSVKPPILGMEVTTTYKEILPNVTLFDEISSVQPMAASGQGGRRTEFRERQQLLSYRFLYSGPPGTPVWKWIFAGRDQGESVAAPAVPAYAQPFGPPPPNI